MGLTISESLRKLRKAARLTRHQKYRRGMMRGVGAAIEHELILQPLAARTVIDVGANIGQFSLLAWQLFPNARIYAFEPQPSPARRFERHFPANAPIKLFRTAIGTRSGKSKMYVSQRNDSSSLLPQTTAMADFFPATENIGTIEVPVAPLETFLGELDMAPPVLLKIDVQGAELDALRGCANLFQFIDYVYVELSFIEFYEGQALSDDVIRYLAENNFRLAGVDNLVRDRHGNSLQADFLFTRREARVQHLPVQRDAVRSAS